MGKNTKKTDKKSSARRKLIPAVAMMMTSAAMLTTSTYAWFTMSKEVSVSSIQLTASVPETLEISLGKVSESVLSAPGTDTVGWKNTVAFTDCYSAIGKLIPASSVDGSSIFYTSGAKDNGLSIKEDAVFMTASSSATKKITGSTSDVTSGYYVDIPVWFRTTTKGTSGETIKLIAKADISAAEGETGDLFKAVRVAVLDDDGTDVGNGNLSSKGVLSNASASYIDCSGLDLTGVTGAISNCAIKAQKAADVSIIPENYDTYYGSAVKSKQFNPNDSSSKTDATQLVFVPKNTGNGVYGGIEKSVIRIWLEGEDKACSNPNAGQSFKIGLTFYDYDQIS